MIEIPEDPVQVWINRAHQMALILMDETVTISAGNMSNRPNEIALQGIGFESLPKEAVISRRVEQYRSPLLLACSVTTLYLFASARRLARATRPASNR